MLMHRFLNTLLAFLGNKKKKGATDQNTVGRSATMMTAEITVYFGIVTLGYGQVALIRKTST